MLGHITPGLAKLIQVKTGEHRLVYVRQS